MYCRNCGKQISDSSKFCPECGATVKEGAENKAKQPEAYGIPALLSFFIPGLGQIVKGEVGRGILIFLGTLLASFTFIGGIIVWIWNIVDAYNKPAGAPAKGTKWLFVIILIPAVILIISISLGVIIPFFRGMQNEAMATKAEGDVRVLKIAMESYRKKHEEFPAPVNYQQALLNSRPQILPSKLYDPFIKTREVEYRYVLSENKEYYVIYSVGKEQTGKASASNSGKVYRKGGAIWTSNGYL